MCCEFSARHEFISQRVKISFFEQFELVNTYKTIVYCTIEYLALKTFAPLPSAFTLNISLHSLTLNTSPLVYQPNRDLLTLNDIHLYTFIKDRQISLISEHIIRTQDN